MARYTGPKSKIARKFGEGIFGPDKVLSKKNYPPGQHGNTRRRKSSEYGLQLREKQKAKYTYGVLEKQFRNLFKRAESRQGLPVKFCSIIESRLDNIVSVRYSSNRAAARQWLHIDIHIDGRVECTFYTVSWTIVGVREKSKSQR